MIFNRAKTQLHHPEVFCQYRPRDFASNFTEYIPDENILWPLLEVIDSFSTAGKIGVGLPLGNLTSQLSEKIAYETLSPYHKPEYGGII